MDGCAQECFFFTLLQGSPNAIISLQLIHLRPEQVPFVGMVSRWPFTYGALA
jgi:hypothetical protein